MNKSEILKCLYGIQCKCYALADLFTGLKEAEDAGFHQDTPAGLSILITGIADEARQLRDEVEVTKCLTE
jgi:hypothetical protein